MEMLTNTLNEPYNVLDFANDNDLGGEAYDPEDDDMDDTEDLEDDFDDEDFEDEFDTEDFEDDGDDEDLAEDDRY